MWNRAPKKRSEVTCCNTEIVSFTSKMQYIIVIVNTIRKVNGKEEG